MTTVIKKKTITLQEFLSYEITTKPAEEIKEYSLSFNAFRDSGGLIQLPRFLKATATVASTSEAGRLIKQHAVSIDGKPVILDNESNSYSMDIKNGSIIQVGKRRFVKVINTDN